MSDRKKRYKKYWCTFCKEVTLFKGRADGKRECFSCRTVLEQKVLDA